MSDSTFKILLVKGGSYSRVWRFYQDQARSQRTNLSGKSPRFLVKFADGTTLEWTVAGGHVAVLSPASNGELTLTLSTAQINALSFKAAAAFLFLDGENELIAEGTVRVR